MATEFEEGRERARLNAKASDLYDTAEVIALRNLVAAAENFSTANCAWFKSKRIRPGSLIPIPGEKETEEVTLAWREMDAAVAAAKEVLR